MNQKRKEFAGWIRQKRKDASLTLNEASENMGYKSTSTIKRIETGYEPVPAKRVIDFASTYDIPMPDLLSKLRELEPRTAKEFDFLEKKFMAYFMQLFKTMATNQEGKMAGLHNATLSDTGSHYQAKHHKPFLNENGYIEIDFSLQQYILSDIDNPDLFSFQVVPQDSLTKFVRSSTKCAPDSCFSSFQTFEDHKVCLMQGSGLLN